MDDKSSRGPEWGQQWATFWRVAGIAFVVAILMGAGAAAGVVIDRKLGTKPAFSIILLLLGLLAGGWYAYRAVMEMLK